MSVPDLAVMAVGFGAALHDAGLPVTPERAGRFALAVLVADVATVSDLYWVARVTLITDREQFDMFDRVFAQVFGGIVDVADTRGDQASPPTVDRRVDTTTVPGRPSPAVVEAGVSPAGALGSADAPGADRDAREMALSAASRQERLATTDFAALEPDELAEVYALMRHLRLSVPMRSGRRARRHRQGDRPDMRATLRRARQTGGDPAVRVNRRRRPRPRRLVVLCDISGSMEPYARAYIYFLHATAGASSAEAFTFATRLTRLTKALAVPHPTLAVSRAAAAAPDWRGGTRIGEAIKAFIDGYGRRGMARSAVVVIVSDGWERDDAVGLGEQMARLRRLAWRIVWVNPRSADPRYRPLTAGMAAALPWVDTVVSGHTLAALHETVTVISAP